mgnify:CR=1 FL=1
MLILVMILLMVLLILSKIIKNLLAYPWPILKPRLSRVPVDAPLMPQHHFFILIKIFYCF